LSWVYYHHAPSASIELLWFEPSRPTWESQPSTYFRPRCQLELVFQSHNDVAADSIETFNS
jgi:hypothetical protein